MATLYITETGVQVHKIGQRLVVKRQGEIIQDIPMIKVDRVVLVGKGASITTPTLYALAQRKVGVFYLNSRGRYILQTKSHEHGNSRLRQAQALATSDPARCLITARAIVHGKVTNQRVLVQRHTEGASWGRQALETMDSMRRQVDSAQTLDELRGREGLAAKEYFSLLRRLLRPPSDGPHWGFERRIYYPSTDPINALLSFAYTLLLNEMAAACQIVGLDPDLGFFHAIDYNKPSMALDLEEEFRPVIADSVVLAAVNRRIFNLGDFEPGSPYRSGGEEDESRRPGPRPTGNAKPVYLKEASRNRFISLYEERVNEQAIYPPTGERLPYRRIFEMQVYRMARVILGETDRYESLVIR
jgi:CRISP-associated protein Cas1